MRLLRPKYHRIFGPWCRERGPQLVGGFVHAVTALPGVTDNPELERVCSRLAISAPHREWKVQVRDLGLDWCYRVFQEPRMTFHGIAFQAGKGTMPRSFRSLDDVRTGESPCCQGGGVSCWASLRSGSCSMSVRLEVWNARLGVESRTIET